MEKWLKDRHSVGCYYCGRLFDERDSIGETPSDGGEVCPDCLDPWWDDFVDDWLATWLYLNVYEPEDAKDFETRLKWLNYQIDDIQVEWALQKAAMYIKQYCPIFKGKVVNLNYEPPEVVIEVLGGVASVEKAPAWIEVIIKDYDIEEEEEDEF